MAATSRCLRSQRRSRRLVFSTVPFYQDEEGSQNHVWVPGWACGCGHDTNSVPRSKVMDLRPATGRSRTAFTILPLSADCFAIAFRAGHAGFVRLLRRSTTAAQLGQPDQLSPSGAPTGGFLMRDHPIVATETGDLFSVCAKSIALDLAVDGRTMPTDLCGNPADRQLCVWQVFDPAPLTQIQLFVRHRPFSLLSSKIGDLSQPSLECAPSADSVATKLKCLRLRKPEMSHRGWRSMAGQGEDPTYRSPDRPCVQSRSLRRSFAL
ncbi:hypothetical protein SAMN04488105_108276 [Salipiger thiooxidans]|uniref:Uncharacterized protein n=1 Tax=Salipiger thiooxidans TaxID=282683 RepID=A0A1G7GBW7_9RHOB|nr:hypothetical protein SAMN04488105_108276 [Salipiger thiooxidans]